MKISLFKNEFFKTLSPHYPAEEIQSFFALLVDHYVQLSRLDVALFSEKELSDSQYRSLTTAVERLEKHEPIQYIIGHTEFFGHKFKVDTSTLIPRPETEELVAWILADCEERGAFTPHILDIGTGSACIACSLAKGLPNANISALDISEAALVVAKSNAELNGVKIDFFQMDIFNLSKLPKLYDIMVSNPPYVRDSERGGMQANVLDYEPAEALFVSDDDPLVYYRQILTHAKSSLKSDGFLYLEINQYLSDDLIKLLEKNNFRHIELRKDIFGKDRMIKSRKNA